MRPGKLVPKVCWTRRLDGEALQAPSSSTPCLSIPSPGLQAHVTLCHLTGRKSEEMTLSWPGEACSQLQAHSSSAGSVAHSPVPLSVLASLVWVTECHLVHAFLPQCPTVHLPFPRSVVGRGKTHQARSQVTKVCIEDMNSLFGGFAVLGTDIISAVSLGVPCIVGSRITGQHLLRLIFLHYRARRDNSTSAGWSTWRNSLQSPHEPFSGPKYPSFPVVWLDR